MPSRISLSPLTSSAPVNGDFGESGRQPAFADAMIRNTFMQKVLLTIFWGFCAAGLIQFYKHMIWQANEDLNGQAGGSPCRLARQVRSPPPPRSRDSHAVGFCRIIPATMRIGFAQINPTVGDFSGNAAKLLAAYRDLVS